MIRYIWACGIYFILLTCQPKTHFVPSLVGFYYWQTTWDWAPTLSRYFQDAQAKVLYVRFFDVDWNTYEKYALPVSPLRKASQAGILPAPIPIVPTIFITNRTMSALPDDEVDILARKLWEKIQRQKQEIFSQNRLEAIQLDCDWSLETREKYFRLCKALKKQIAPIPLSATIRLHQIKYPQKTGLPPIDKGVLMCYNVGKIDGKDTQNSILDLEIVRSYIKSLPSYPIHLDIALPTFGWGVLKREDAVIKLLQQVHEDDFESHKYLKTGAFTWRVQEEHYLAGTYLYRGDEIRLEQTSPALLQRLIDELQPYLKGKRIGFIFYHLHDKLSNIFKVEDLQKITHPKD